MTLKYLKGMVRNPVFHKFEAHFVMFYSTRCAIWLVDAHRCRPRLPRYPTSRTTVNNLFRGISYIRRTAMETRLPMLNSFDTHEDDTCHPDNNYLDKTTLAV